MGIEHPPIVLAAIALFGVMVLGLSLPADGDASAYGENAASGSPTCTCPGGTPSRLALAMRRTAGDCGRLDPDSGSVAWPLECGGLYFGGGGVSLPMPITVAESATAVFDVSCEGSALTLHPTSADERGRQGCTRSGCALGPPTPAPNRRHGEASASACVVLEVAGDFGGRVDCTDGTVELAVGLRQRVFLDGDLLPSRCEGGSTPGRGCTADADCGPGGDCRNDFGRCMGGARAAGACWTDDDCEGGGTCESGACAGGTHPGAGCSRDADCPGAGARCRTLMQPCPVCNAITGTCNGGPNDGRPCMAGVSGPDGEATSIDCPPPAEKSRDGAPIAATFSSGVVRKSARDLPDQVSVFCGYCRNRATNRFARPPVPCVSNADCATVSGFQSCGQRTAGAFTSEVLGHEITETGAPAGALSVGGPAKAATLVAVFCVPPTFDAYSDNVADLPGPAAMALPASVRVW